MVRVLVRRNGSSAAGCMMKRPDTMDQLLALADTKLLKQPGAGLSKRLFASSGDEILPDDIDCLERDDVVYVSCGEDFIPASAVPGRTSPVVASDILVTPLPRAASVAHHEDSEAEQLSGVSTERREALHGASSFDAQLAGADAFQQDLPAVHAEHTEHAAKADSCQSEDPAERRQAHVQVTRPAELAQVSAELPDVVVAVLLEKDERESAIDAEAFAAHTSDAARSGGSPSADARSSGASTGDAPKKDARRGDSTGGDAPKGEVPSADAPFCDGVDASSLLVKARAQPLRTFLISVPDDWSPGHKLLLKMDSERVRVGLPAETECGQRLAITLPARSAMQGQRLASKKGGAANKPASGVGCKSAASGAVSEAALQKKLAEKEAAERARAAGKAAREAHKAAEREEQEAARAAERAKREAERLEREAAKEAQRAEKEATKRVRDAEREERQAKEQQLRKKQAITNFFGRPAAPKPATLDEAVRRCEFSAEYAELPNGGACGSDAQPSADAAGAEAPKEATILLRGGRMLRPFYVDEFTKQAPGVPSLSSAAGRKAARRLERRLAALLVKGEPAPGAAAPAPSRMHRRLAWRRALLGASKGPPWLWARQKVLAFHEDVRPAYRGTFTRPRREGADAAPAYGGLGQPNPFGASGAAPAAAPAAVPAVAPSAAVGATSASIVVSGGRAFQLGSGRVSGRRPLGRDEGVFDYDVDSEAEWEPEGEGEELPSEDEVEADDDANSDGSMDDDFIDDSGDAAAAKAASRSAGGETLLLGPLLSGGAVPDALLAFTVQQLAPAVFSETDAGPTPATPSAEEAAQQQQGKGRPVKHVPEELLPELVSLVHGSTLPIAKIAEAFLVGKQEVSKAQVEKRIRAIAENRKWVPTSRSYWRVHEETRAALGLPEDPLPPPPPPAAARTAPKAAPFAKAAAKNGQTIISLTKVWGNAMAAADV